MMYVIKDSLVENRMKILHYGEGSIEYYCKNTGVNIKMAVRHLDRYGLHDDKGLYLFDSNSSKKRYYQIEKIKKIEEFIKIEMRNISIMNILKSQ